MKSIKAVIIAILLVTAGNFAASSQSLSDSYRAAVGLRAGETSGLTLKINTKKGPALEFIAGLWNNWISFTGLYEKNAPAFKVDGLRWYYGGGGHLAFATRSNYYEGRSYASGEDYGFGIDGIVGLEYKIPQIPIALSLDMKPLMEIYRNGNLNFGFDPGFGVKFTF